MSVARHEVSKDSQCLLFGCLIYVCRSRSCRFAKHDTSHLHTGTEAGVCNSCFSVCISNAFSFLLITTIHVSLGAGFI